MESNTAATRLPAAIVFPGSLLLVISGGMMIGLGTAAVGSFFYPPFVFPLLMGLVSGNIVRDLVRLAQIRRAGQVVLLSVLMTAAIYGAYHYGRYLALQVSTSLELFSNLDSALEEENLAAARTLVDYALQDETGRAGFAGSLLYRAKTGLSIGRFYSQSRLHLGPALTWLYWALEIGLTLGIILSLGRKPLSGPLCEACGSRYGRETHIGGTAPANEPLLLGLIERNDAAGLGKLLEKDAGLPSVEVYLQRCVACGKSTSLITVRRACLGARGSVLFSDVSKATLPPRDSTLFLSQLGFEVE